MLNPFALPIHPVVNHVAVACLALTWIFLVVRYATGNQLWETWLQIFEVVGVIALPPTIVAGFVDTRGFDFVLDPRADAPLIWHMTAGLVTSIAFGTHYFWRRRRGADDFHGATAILDLSLATFAMLALVATGLLAGELVYGT
jgi:uncharacterized membrane protein